MKPLRLLTCLLTVILSSALAPAQTTTWVGQSPPDPTRFSSWTDGANWSTGTVPNGAFAIAGIAQPYQTPGGLVTSDNLQILNADVILDALQYELFAPSYYQTGLNLPTLMIGGSGLTDRGSLVFTGAGIRSSNPAVYFYPQAGLVLRNGALRFTNAAAIELPMSINAYEGTNQVWFADDSRARLTTITTGAASRVDFGGRSRFESGQILSYGSHIGLGGNSSLHNSTVFMNGAGLTLFADDAVVTSSYFYFNRPAGSVDAILNFSGRTSVQGGSVYSPNSASIVEFTDQADSNQFNVTVRQLDITGASTGRGTTGRSRAAVNTPAPVSIVADDARTVSLGQVNIVDLLLGSNSVRVNGGGLRYISDLGGAYLSVGGANLTGGGVIQDGPVSLFLFSADNSPYAVPLTIARGLVQSFRQHLGPVGIHAAGQFQPLTGTIASVVNHGRFIHGSSSFRIQGNYTQSASGILTVSSLPGSSQFSSLEVGGTASLDGRLEVFGSGGYFVDSHRFLILRASAVTGRFNQAPELRLSPMLSTAVEYVGNEVYFVQRQNPFVLAGATPSQQALGGHLDATLEQASGSYYQLLLRLNGNQNPAIVAAGLGQLAPDRYGVLNEQGFAVAASRQAALDHRLATWRTTPGPGGFVTFAEGSRLENEFAAIDGLPEVRFTSRGGLAGAGWRRDRWILGGSAAKDTARANLDGWGSSVRIESTAPGLFARYDRGRFFVHAAATRSSDRYTLVRNSGLLNWPAMVSGRGRGSRTDLALTAGTSLGRTWRLTPQVGVLASQVKLDDFAETRSAGQPATELAFRHWSVGSLRTRAGLELARPIAGDRITPRLSVTWLHELEKDRTLSAGLLATNGAFYHAPGRPAETDLVQASIGLDWRITRRLGFSLNAGLARGRNTDTTSDLSAGLRWEF